MNMHISSITHVNLKTESWLDFILPHFSLKIEKCWDHMRIKYLPTPIFGESVTPFR